MKQPKLLVGALVVSADDRTIGVVKKVRTDDFLVDRPARRDLYVPFAAILGVPETDRIELRFRLHEIDDQGWASPPLV
jgi:hypothetical protein